jgi:hypothetical protein
MVTGAGAAARAAINPATPLPMMIMEGPQKKKEESSYFF